MAGRVRRTNAEIDNAVMTELEKLVIRQSACNGTDGQCQFGASRLL